MDSTFSYWTVVRWTAWILLRQVLLFTPLAAVTLLVQRLCTAALLGRSLFVARAPPGHGWEVFYAWVATVPAIVICMLAAAFVTHRALATLSRLKLPLGESLSAVGKAFPTLVVIALLWLTLDALAVLPDTLGGSDIVPHLIMGNVPFSVWAKFLFLFLTEGAALAITVAAGLCWTAAVPVALAEGGGPVTALRRSYALTEGRRLPIFMLWLTAVILNALAYFGIYLIFGQGLPPRLPPPLFSLEGAAIAAVNAFFLVVYPVGVAAIYAELRWTSKA